MKNLLLLTSLLSGFLSANCQFAEHIHSSIQLESAFTSKNTLPFWMRSNKSGNVGLPGLSGAALASSWKDYEDPSPSDILYGRQKLIDWGYGLEGRANAGRRTNLTLLQAYLKLKIWKFQVKAGRSNNISGLNGDTILSTGNFSVSGNALGVPNLEVSIPEYLPLPFLDKLFAIKGTFSHGWLGTQGIRQQPRFDDDGNFVFVGATQAKTYLHQKSLYGRLGRDDWRFKIIAGFNHQVFWGSEDKIFDNNFGLSPVQTFLYVASGKAYGGRSHGENGVAVLRSKIGNHLGSIDIGGEYIFDLFSINVYRQNFYDVGALGKLANLRDGLTGISIRNLEYEQSDRKFNWQRILFEVFFTKNQAGEIWSKPTASGDENYYNNYLYLNGWTYIGQNLGNPLITQRKYGRNNLISDPQDHFINNRVVAFHLGFRGSLNDWLYTVKSTYSNNFGTFATSPAGRSTGKTGQVPPQYGLFGSKNQFSFYLESSRTLGNGLQAGYVVGADCGELLENSLGVGLHLRKFL